ncbi:hypothetical protein JCM1840_005344 [Sporobolomyces johnsonii]
MSYSNSQPPRRTAPLIQRPSTSAPPSSNLGAALGGALAGMGYPGTQGNARGPAYPGYGGQGGQGAMRMQHPLPAYPGFPQGGATPGYAQAGHYAGQQPIRGGRMDPSQAYPPSNAQGLPPPPQQRPSAYPSSFYPSASPSHLPFPPHLQQHQHSYASTSSGYPQHQPLTTPDGYTLSSSYVPPASASPSAGPSASSSRPPRGGRQDNASAQPARGGGGGPQTIKCCKDDCSFTGSRKQVREHEEDRHLIYAPGREPKPWSGSLKPIDGAVIEGTGISLDTPEAVAKWIEDRKKRWPSKKVVEDKEKQRAERVAAGLEAPPRDRSSRGRGRGGARGDYGSARGRGRGRGGAWAGRGDAAAPGETDEREAKRVKLDASDSDSSSSSSTSSGSDSEEDEDDGPPEIASSKEALAALLGDAAGAELEAEGDEDETATVASEEQSVKAEEEREAAKKQFQVVCRHWRKGNCALGDDKCPYLHSLPANASAPPPPKRQRPAPRSAPHNPFARPFSDPFSLLEERDTRHVVSDVLQAIEFLAANDWLRGVEVRVGQMDEESGIEVIEEATKEVEHEGEGDVAEMDDEATAASESTDPPRVDLEPLMITPHHAPPPASSLPLIREVVAPLPAPASAPAPAARMGLVADYGSDTDDEAEEQAVAAVLRGGQ